MENSAANQLPEAHSLPDGFVESSEVEKPFTDYKERFHEQEVESVDPSRSSNGDIRLSDKPRTFPVPLSDTDRIKPAEEKLGHGGELGDGSLERNFQNSDSTAEGCSELQSTNVKDRTDSKATEYIKDRKVFQDASSEGKHKMVKRSSKAEKELLEFTLKYQQVIAERDSAIAVREKLESLCRELQRQNKMLMDECKRVSAEGQNLRLDLSTKFHDALKDVSNKLEEQKDECLSQLKENEMLRNKLKHLCDQYALSEQQFQQKLKQKTLELELAELQFQQHQEKATQEQTRMKLYAEQITQLLTTEKSLRIQLAADGEKFQQFQDALSKSNEVFETFKQEMEKMAKSMKELKKENIFLKSKCDKSDVSLIELVEEREFLKKQLDKVKHQKEKLESLCRSLQAERKLNLVGSSPTPSEVKVGSIAGE